MIFDRFKLSYASPPQTAPLSDVKRSEVFKPERLGTPIAIYLPSNRNQAMQLSDKRKLARVGP